MTKRTLALATSTLVGLAGLIATREASAQDLGGVPGGVPLPTGVSPTNPSMEPTPLGDSGYETRGRSPRSVKLFDSERSQLSYQLDVGPLWYRRKSESTPLTERSNFKHYAPLASEIGIGSLNTTVAGPFYLVGHQKTLLRILDDKSFSWAVFHQELGGGIHLGPFEPEVRLRLGAFVADVIHAQPSLQLLTPGVSGGLGLHFGHVRIDVHGNIDYLWRWFGPDYLTRSVTIGIRFDAPRPTPFPRDPEQR